MKTTASNPALIRGSIISYLDVSEGRLENNLFMERPEVLQKVVQIVVT